MDKNDCIVIDVPFDFGEDGACCCPDATCIELPDDYDRIPGVHLDRRIADICGVIGCTYIDGIFRFGDDHTQFRPSTDLSDARLAASLAGVRRGPNATALEICLQIVDERDQ